MNYIIATDSCSDLPVEIIEKYEIPVIPMEFIMDGKTYKNYPDHREFALEDFYKLMKEGHTGTTSQLTAETIEEFFTPYLEEGNDVLYVVFSSALSGTYANACKALERLKAKFPERKIFFVDSLTASTAEGKMVYEAALNRENGFSIEENAASLEETKLNLAVWFTVDDLQCLRRGGRLSATAAFLGSLLSIKPVLHVTDEGKLVPVEKTIGRKASLLSLIKRCKEDILDPENDAVFIASALSFDDEKRVEEKLRNELHVKNVFVSKIGPVIGMHSGPGTFLVTFYSKKR